MTGQKIRVAVSHLVNLGNFENITPRVELEGEVLEGETNVDAYERISKEVHAMWAREFRHQLDEHVQTRDKARGYVIPTQR